MFALEADSRVKVSKNQVLGVAVTCRGELGERGALCSEQMVEASVQHTN